MIKRKKWCFQYSFSVFCGTHHQKTSLVVFVYLIFIFSFQKKCIWIQKINTIFQCFYFPIPLLYTSFFSVSRNNLTGEIPYLICNLSSLQYLDLSFNHLNNMIPLCLEKLSDHLKDLDLQSNNLHFTIPKTFAKGYYLKSLQFNGNQLEGSLPQPLVHCRSILVTTRLIVLSLVGWELFQTREFLSCYQTTFTVP